MSTFSSNYPQQYLYQAGPKIQNSSFESIQKKHSFIKDLTTDLRQYQRQLSDIKKQRASLPILKEDQYQPQKTINLQNYNYQNINDKTADKTSMKNGLMLNQKQFVQITAKKVSFDDYAPGSTNTKSRNKYEPILNEQMQYIPIQSLKIKYNKLLNENSELRKNRIEWKQYDRVRTQNAQLRKRSLQLNEQIINQRNQLGISRRQLQNIKNMDIKRLQIENRHLKQQLNKLRQVSGRDGGYQLMRLKVDNQNLQNQLNQVQNNIEQRIKIGYYDNKTIKSNIDTQRQLQLKERINSLLNTNSILDLQINKIRTMQNNYLNQIEILKNTNIKLQKSNQRLQNDKINLNIELTQLKTQNRMKVQQRQYFQSNQQIQKIKRDKIQVMRQLQDKIKENLSLKTKIKQISDDYSNKFSNNQIMYKQKLKSLQKQLIINKKGDKQSAQIDDILKNQIFQNQRFKDSLNSRGQEIHYLQQQLKVFKAEAENAKNQLEVEKVKSMVDKKNIQNSWEVEKQNLLGEENLIKKQMESLKDKVKYLSEETKKKDEFIKKQLLIKVSNNQSLQKYIEDTLSQYQQIIK